MVKASRRVKRIKRSKKQVHRAHGRKTNRRRQMQRHTRRQRGGMGFFQSFVKQVSTEKLNPKNGPLYDGIEVFKVDLQDGARYYIGNQPLIQYLRSSIPTEIAYGKKIQKALDGIDQMVDQGDTFKDQLFLDQVNFDKFQAKFPAAAGAGAGAAAAASVTAPVAEKPDSNKIFIKSTGVQFGAIFKPWGVSNTCEFSDDENPCFTQYVFTKHEKPKLVNVKYVMPSMDAKTYCALAAYEAVQLYSLVPRFDYGLISPGVTVTFELQEKDEITSSFLNTGIQLTAHYGSCKEPYDDSLYTFYQDRNSLVAAMFFDKPDKVVEWSDQVYINLIKKHIAEGKENAVNPIFPKAQTSIMMIQLEDFELRLNALTAKPDSEGLKQLDSEVTNYIRTGFQGSLLQAKKTKASLAAQMRDLSVRGPGAGAAGRP